MAVSGIYVYVADGNSGLRVINVSDPTSPSEIGYYSAPGCANGIAISGSYADLAAEDLGLRIIDISTPSSPKEVGFCATPDRAYGVAVSGSYAYVADWSAGLRVIAVSTPSSPEEVGYYTTPGDADGVTVSGSHVVYVTDASAGLQIYLNLLAVEESNKERVKTYLHCFPNPFNKSVEVRYQLHVKSNVSLRIYDLTGRLITTLADEEMDTGEHTLQWNAKNISSGIYFIKFKAGTYEQTNKVVLKR